MIEKLKELKQREVLRKKFYDLKTVAYYIPYMFKVDDKRLDHTVPIPWQTEDCFDIIEYPAFNQDILRTYILL
jgi:hypothetical protein